MRFEFQSGSGTRLPLLPELPDVPLARLEGYNGIGKTLTIRLLQLCSGRQPFLGLPLAWTSLHEAVGDLTIVATGLRGAESMRWRLLPENWTDVPEPDVDDRWFEIEIDGKRSSLREVRRLLGVERLGGDAGLAETLGLQVDADRRRVEAVVGPLVDPDDSLLAAVLERLDRGVQTVRRVEASGLLQAQEGAVQTRAALERARTNLQVSSERFEELRWANETRVRLEEHDRLGKTLDEQIRTFDAELAELASRRDPLASKLVDLEEQASRTEDARAAMKRVRDRLDKHVRAEQAESDAITSLQVAANVERLDALEDVVSELKKELRELVARRAAIDAAPLLREVATDLAARLKGAESEGLGERRLFDDPTDAHATTVTQWRARLEARATSLAKESPTLQGAAVATRIEQLNRRLGAAEEIPRRRTELERRERLARQAQADMDQLLRDSDPKAVEQVESLRRQLEALDTRTRQIAYQRAALASMAADADAPPSPGQLRSELATRLAKLNLAMDGIAAALASQPADVATTETAFAEAERADREASERLAILLAELDRATTLLSEDPEFAWLRAIRGVSLPDANAPLERRLEMLTQLGDTLEKALDRAGAVPAQVAAITAALEQIARRLKGLDETPAPRYEQALSDGYGGEFARMFDLPAIRAALFGEGSKVIGVDLRRGRLELRYADAKGEVTARPLEAFSRGEQAFAYTQARLAALDATGERPQNRLIVLDEFGAFIARDRLARLIALLSERASEHKEDQILLILPVSGDYRAQAEVATGQEHERLTALAEKLDHQGFIVEKLAASVA